MKANSPYKVVFLMLREIAIENLHYLCEDRDTYCNIQPLWNVIHTNSNNIPLLFHKNKPK